MSSPTAAAGTVTIFPRLAMNVTFRAAYVHFLVHIFADLTGAPIALSRRDRLGRISDAICQWGVITDRISRTIICHAGWVAGVAWGSGAAVFNNSVGGDNRDNEVDLLFSEFLHE